MTGRNAVLAAVAVFAFSARSARVEVVELTSGMREDVSFRLSD